MKTAFDAAYDAQRRKLIENASNTVAALWKARTYGDESSFTSKAIPVVLGAQRALVSLTCAYMSQKVRMHVKDPAFKTMLLPANDFTVEDLRGVSAQEVYSRPFGTLGAHLAQGDTFQEADAVTGEYVKKLVATDCQLVQTHAVRAWTEAYNNAS